MNTTTNNNGNKRRVFSSCIILLINTSEAFINYHRRRVSTNNSNNILCSSVINNSNDSGSSDNNADMYNEEEAEVKFYEEYIKYMDRKLDELLFNKSSSSSNNSNNYQTDEVAASRGGYPNNNQTEQIYKRRKLSDWQLYCGARYSSKILKSSKRRDLSQQCLVYQTEKTPSTGLCLVPSPLSSPWDILQRYRFNANDDTLYSLPPHISLFRPFVSRVSIPSAATATAELFELLPSSSVSPLEIVFDRVILRGPRLVNTTSSSDDGDDQECAKSTDDYWEELIEKEVKLGKQRLEKRKQKLGMKAQASTDVGKEKVPYFMDESEDKTEDNNKSKKRIRPPTMKEIEKLFKGCQFTLFLAPNKESRRRLINFRRTLKQELFGCYDIIHVDSKSIEYYDCIYTQLDPLVRKDTAYEPLLMVGDKMGVRDAFMHARIIQDELSKNVLKFEGDKLHFISSDQEVSKEEDNSELENEVRDKLQSQNTKQLFTFGCDATVSLIRNDDNSFDENDEIENYGDSGDSIDFDAMFSALIEEAEEDAKKAFDSWNDDELETMLAIEDSLDDWNEGATISIGRTQFFLGEKREYDMPASNPFDSKEDCYTSGASRRRTARHGSLRWNDGDYGRKASDNA